jgi:hypothetical protein
LITAEDILTTQGKHPDRAQHATEEDAKNAADLASRLNRLFADPEMDWLKNEPEFSDGYRDPGVTYGAKKSAHKEGKAVDVVDKARKLALYLVAHSYLLERYGLWMESPDYTIGKKTDWAHLQSRPVRGRRVFIP